MNITHTYIGDLTVELVAPDGVAYVLHNRTGGAKDNLVVGYTVNASGRPLAGTWTLRIKDHASFDNGVLRAWSLTFP